MNNLILGEAYRIEIKRPVKAVIVHKDDVETITLRTGEPLTGVFTGTHKAPDADTPAVVFRSAEYNYADVRLDTTPKGHFTVHTGCGIKEVVARF